MMDRGQSLIWQIEYVDYRLSGNCRGELMFYARYERQKNSVVLVATTGNPRAGKSWWHWTSGASAP